MLQPNHQAEIQIFIINSKTFQKTIKKAILVGDFNMIENIFLDRLG